MTGPGSLGSTTVLVGIDDTDNISSRGTGHLMQRLVAGLAAADLGRPLGATRHQLLDDPRIPSTSHNSSACLALAVDADDGVAAITAYCGEFLAAESAPGSDPGLVVADGSAWAHDPTRQALIAFGDAAKHEVVDLASARRLAAASGVHASGHGGDEGGIIGALAAVGLHLSGDDGFFLWMPGIRDLGGRVTYAELRALVPVDVARDPDGAEPAPGDVIELGDWVRPVWSDHRAVLLLWTPRDDDASGRVWPVAARYIVRQY